MGLYILYHQVLLTESQMVASYYPWIFYGSFSFAFDLVCVFGAVVHECFHRQYWSITMKMMTRRYCYCCQLNVLIVFCASPFFDFSWEPLPYYSAFLAGLCHDSDYDDASCSASYHDVVHVTRHNLSFGDTCLF